MTNLSVRSFAPFFRAIHGCDPFPWQTRLVQHLHETGRWPEGLDLPTGTGKTAALDAAVFHLALQAGKPERTAPLRILYVVDRRTIVDQAHERAVRIQAALANSEEPAVVAVKERLCGLAGGPIPLAVAVLRGGIARDDSWARTPTQPLIAVSTVDQVGSRLLFRGYGVSDAMRPIHAGLVANDALLLLDEVHLSEPFVETLEHLAQRYMSWAEVPLPRRWQWVPMSATPRAARKGALTLLEEDERHPVLARRLAARRPARLREIAARGEGDAAQRLFVGALCEEALQMARGGRAVAVVVNRVATAGAVHELLRERLNGSADVWLVTGRMRPIEREETERGLRLRVGAGRTRGPDERPAVVVATQCIEAGADLDFDGLVTECASLDALRQRFGRLNRLGEIDDAEGAILVRKDALKTDDPVYGGSLARTWQYLSSLTKLDFALDRFRIPPKKELSELLPPVHSAPVLLPAHLDAWVQTAPVPAADPEVALWLHGPERGQPEVQVVWRSDLSAAMLRDASLDERVIKRVESCPPTGLEALAVPLAAARRWLAGAGGEAGVPDVEGSGGPDERIFDSSSARRALAWRGDQSEVVSAGGVRPGDTLVVPAEYGGIAHGNWAPESRTLVVDLGDRAFAARRNIPLLRLHAAALAAHVVAERETAPSWASPPVPLADCDAESDAPRLDGWLDAIVADDAAPAWLKRTAGGLIRELQSSRAPRLLRLDGAADQAPHLVVVGREPFGRASDETSGSTSEDDTASFTGIEMTLREHRLGVGELAGDFGRCSGLPSPVVDDLVLAGEWHDAGKVDPRFQAMLCGGSAFAAEIAREPVAKSRIPVPDRAAREAARARAGYPPGARHELVSLALLAASDAARKRAHDWDLVQHLVASHHGHCRPFAPYAEDARPVEVVFADSAIEVRVRSDHHLESFGSGVSDRFWRLVNRYGWFGLAWLEAILRLADHRRSEREQRG